MNQDRSIEGMTRRGFTRAALALAVLAGLAAPMAKAADKKATRGTPYGKVHGGEDGTPFRDKAYGRLATVTVRSGSWVDSIQCTWDDEGAVDKGTTHGGDGGSPEVLKLEPGERLIKVSGVLRKGDNNFCVIGSLSFETTKKKVGPFGETTDGEKFTIEAPEGQEICGFQGRGGSYLQAVGVVVRPKGKQP